MGMDLKVPASHYTRLKHILALWDKGSRLQAMDQLKQLCRQHPQNIRAYYTILEKSGFYMGPLPPKQNKYTEAQTEKLAKHKTHNTL